MDVSQGVCLPEGFYAAGVRAGIKERGLDIALLGSDRPCVAGGVFTQNAFSAPAVRLCQKLLASARSVRGVVINSGNANACTGERGERDAEEMSRLGEQALAQKLPGGAGPCLVAQTGLIGVYMPMDLVRPAIAQAGERLSRSGGPDAAQAIMTTDSFPKTAAAQLALAGTTVCIGAMTKGAGMICPRMATTLGFVTTDATLTRRAAQQAILRAAQETYNRVSVDGDTSTNDTLLLFANGAAGGETIDVGGAEFEKFCAALREVCLELALALVRDGEGATRVAEIRVEGAASEDDARRAAEAVARSLLVKTALFGADPNWGRIAAALGYSGAKVDPRRTVIEIGGVALMEGGAPGLGDAARAAQAMREKHVLIRINLGLGRAAWRTFTCDLTYDYVRLNAEYHT